jgi:hypothetical protein
MFFPWDILGAVLDKKKRKVRLRPYPLKGKKYTCTEGLIRFFILLKQLNERITPGI